MEKEERRAGGGIPLLKMTGTGQAHLGIIKGGTRVQPFRINLGIVKEKPNSLPRETTPLMKLEEGKENSIRPISTVKFSKHGIMTLYNHPCGTRRVSCHSMLR